MHFGVGQLDCVRPILADIQTSMQFRLSTLLLVVAVVALLLVVYLQYRHLDTLKTELLMEQKQNTLLKTEIKRLYAGP